MKIIDKNKTIFFNVDTQFDFMESDGSLYVDGAEEIKPTLKKLTDFAKDNQIRVVNTMDWHFRDSEELSKEPDFAITFPEHCMADTKGSNFIEETDPIEPYIIDWSINLGLEYIPNSRNLTIRKDKFDVFEGNPNTNRITELFKKGGYDTIVVYGVSGDICVSFAVNGLLERGFKVILVEDGIRSLNSNTFDNLLEIWNKNDNFYLETSDFSI